MADDRDAMVAEIRSIIKRSSYSESTIVEGINHAIATRQVERLFFNENESIQFTCVVGQSYYSEDDDADIGLIASFDDVHIRISNSDYGLRLIRTIGEFETLTDGNVPNGQPRNYIYYNKKIGIYPPPDDTYVITVMGGYEPAAPADGSEENNVWMTDGYLLILYDAVGWLDRVHLRDYNHAALMEDLAKKQLSVLERKTVRRKASNRIRPTTF